MKLSYHILFQFLRLCMHTHAMVRWCATLVFILLLPYPPPSFTHMTEMRHVVMIITLSDIILFMASLSPHFDLNPSHYRFPELFAHFWLTETLPFPFDNALLINVLFDHFRKAWVTPKKLSTSVFMTTDASRCAVPLYRKHA